MEKVAGIWTWNINGERGGVDNCSMENMTHFF